MMLPTAGGGALSLGQRSRCRRRIRCRRSSNQQRPKPALVSSRPGLMADHRRLGIVERLDLQQRRRSAGSYLRAGLAQHQPFAAERFDPGQFRAQMIDALAQLMLVRLRRTAAALLGQAICVIALQPFFERLR